MGTNSANPFSTSMRDMADAKPHLRPQEVEGVVVPESVARKGCSLEGDGGDGDAVGDLSSRDCQRLEAKSPTKGGRNA
jgi:hypothetical protein